MKELTKLLKLQFINIFSINTFIHEKDKRKKRNYLLLLVVWILLAVSILYINFSFSKKMIEFNLANIMFEILYALTSILILFTTILKAGDIIYNLDSYENLVSLPIKRKNILSSKIIYLYIINFGLTLFIFLPSIITYMVAYDFSLNFAAKILISILLLPLIPLSISSFLAALFKILSSKNKNKNIINAILIIFITIFIQVVLNKAMIKINSSTANEITVLINNLQKTLEKIYILNKWFRLGVLENKIFYLILFLLVSITIFILLFIILNLNYKSLLFRLNKVASNKTYSLNKLKTSSVLYALYKKEAKRYVASSPYLINTIIGPVISIIASVALIIYGKDKLDLLLNFNLNTSLILYPLVFFLVMNPTTCSSISLEGKNFYIVQSLPIKTKDIINSKILLNLTIIFPAYLISSIILLNLFKLDIISVFKIIFLPLVYIFFSVVVGIFINLKFPVFNYQNEMLLVKSSASVGLTLFINALCIVVPLFLSLKFMKLSLIIETIFLVFYLITSIILYKKCIKEKLYKLA